MSRCRSCARSIHWAKTEKARAIPLDREPVAGGNIELVDGVAKYVSPNPEVRRYVSHFVTCPYAREHRNDARRTSGKETP